MIYSLVESVFTEKEGVNYKTYETSARVFNENIPASYPDIFFNKRKTEKFFNLCNESKLELCHLSDIIEDVMI